MPEKKETSDCDKASQTPKAECPSDLIALVVSALMIHVLNLTIWTATTMKYTSDLPQEFKWCLPILFGVKILYLFSFVAAFCIPEE